MRAISFLLRCSLQLTPLASCCRSVGALEFPLGAVKPISRFAMEWRLWYALRSFPRLPHKCPCWSRGGWGPFSLTADEGVCEDEKLSHDCHDGDLGGFSGFDHGLVFGFEFRVASDGVEGGHVESLSGSWAAATDGSLAMGLATVPCERCETYENWLEAHRYLNMNDLKEHKKTNLRQAA